MNCANRYASKLTVLILAAFFAQLFQLSRAGENSVPVLQLSAASAQNIAQPQQNAAKKDADATRYIGVPITPLTSGPGGGKIGDLYQNVRVELLDQKGDWSKVSIEGWMRSRSLTHNSVGRKPHVRAAAAQPLTIEGFTLKKETEKLDRPRMYLTLKLKNHTEKAIDSWTGLLAVQPINATTEVHFRETISQTDANIPPGGVAEVSFYWDDSEDPYQPLSDNRPEEMKMTLFRVKINEQR